MFIIFLKAQFARLRVACFVVTVKEREHRIDLLLPPTHPKWSGAHISSFTKNRQEEERGGCVQNTRLWKCICWAGREFGVRRSSARRQDWCPQSGNNSLSLLYSSFLLNNRARKMHNVIDTYSSWSTILKWEPFSISIDLICKEY